MKRPLANLGANIALTPAWIILIFAYIGTVLWTVRISFTASKSFPVIIVAVILQVTGVWNDFLFGLIFAGQDNLLMTVQLNNIVHTARGAKEYNVHMAATILTALLPLLVYFFSGRWFVRGISLGAVKR